MDKIFRRLIRREASLWERGQSLVLIAAAFIGLAAFVGLAVDSGILFITYAHLRRAVDAAAIAAATQMREKKNEAQLEVWAREFVQLNNVDPQTVKLSTFNYNNSDATHTDLYGLVTDPQRQLVRVEATSVARLTFMSLFGFYTQTIKADATSEAAALDVVLVIDVSSSMADDSRAAGNWPACNTVTPVTCQPFVKVREAAKAFVRNLTPPYDRVSLVTYAREVYTTTVFLTTTFGITSTLDSTILDASTHPAGIDLTTWEAQFGASNPNTNTGDALQAAGNKLKQARREALWVVVLLSDGATNITHMPVMNATTSSQPGFFGWCPDATMTDGSPFCRDNDSPDGFALAFTRHSLIDADANVTADGGTDPDGESGPPGTAAYDAEDYARDQADFVGCPNGDSDYHFCSSEHHGTDADLGTGQGWKGGQSALIFSIGLGQVNMVDLQTKMNCAGGINCGITDAGERLLRYIAYAGYRTVFLDGSVTTDPCAGASRGSSCGNYYFAPDADALQPIFEDIAQRVFTRLVH